jgi:K(+)-stimulated pyrophosphate-energized sodium pump
MQDLFWFAPVGSTIALLFSALLIVKIMKAPRGTSAITLVQDAIFEGANAYLKRQYKVVSIFFAVVFVLFLFMAKQGLMVIFVPFAFLTGGIFSGLSGYIGMQVAIRANGRTTFAASKSLNSGLRIAFSSGAVMGFVVVGLGLLDLSIWYYLLNYFYRDLDTLTRLQNITTTMLSFGMGASCQALFARVGGGIFTKAADVGADLVGKVEAGIPEDDVRNPATIADNVGDNVGDVAGMGADLYESYVGSMVATMVLAVAAGLGVAGVTVPMIMAAVGIIASIIGTFFVRSDENASQKTLLAAIRRGVVTAAVLVAISGYFIVTAVLGQEHQGVYFSILAGLVAGVIIGFSTEFFTSDCYSPTKSISKSAITGAATVIISGLGVGMVSTAIPVIVIVAAIWVSFWSAGGLENYGLGLYGVGIAAVGMLSTLGITLATDSYGPVADNAGGIAQTSGQKPIVRQRTDALDSLGNTTAATGKGFAIGSAALTALALIVAYRADIEHLGGTVDLSLLNPRLICGMFIGAMLPYFFSALTINAVGNAAQSIVMEVRRQFKEVKGLMEGKAKAEYGKCVHICTVAAQKQMILPAVAAILSPIIVGLVFNVEGVMGLLTGALVSGFMLAIFSANAGGAWDNAKKYIEAGNHGGKGSNPHKATVVGDTVGDPLKDTSGPSVNILIKLMSMVSVVFAGFILQYSFFQ